MDLSVVILAAGKGSRMNIDCPKVLLPILQKPMISYLLDTIAYLKVKPILVLGHQKERVKSALEAYCFETAFQAQQLGTGHALLQSLSILEKQNCKQVLVLSGDVPFVDKNTLESLFTLHQKKNASISLLSAWLKDPKHYGRIIKNEDGKVQAIREFKDCSDMEAKIQEINAGMYIFNYSLLQECLSQLSSKNAQQEFYLTDLIEIAVKKQLGVYTHIVDNHMEIHGANTPSDLALLEEYAQTLNKSS